MQIHHIEIARSPFMFNDNQKALRQLLLIIKNYHIQVIHCHTPVGDVYKRQGLSYRPGQGLAKG